MVHPLDGAVSCAQRQPRRKYNAVDSVQSINRSNLQRRQTIQKKI